MYQVRLSCRSAVKRYNGSFDIVLSVSRTLKITELDGEAQGAENLFVDNRPNAPLVMLVDGTVEAIDIAETLEEGGYRIVRLGSTIEAESLFVSSPPGAIVLGLEEEGALGFCDLVRAIPRVGGVPLIVMGSSADPYQTAKNALLHGADAFLRRPVDHDELLSQLGALLGDRGPASSSGEHLDSSVSIDSVEETADETDEQQTADEEEETATPKLPAAGESTREPTQVLEEQSSPIDRILRAGGFPFEGDFATGETFGLGPMPVLGPESAPWELDQELPLPDEEEIVTSDIEAEPLTSARPDTELPTMERQLSSDDSPSFEEEDDPTEDVEIPLSLPSSLASLRAERTHVFTSDGKIESTPGEGGDSPFTNAAHSDSELSAEFRKVIEEVAHRLFPEVSPDEYQDEDFDEIKTIVPQVNDAPSPYDLDDLEDDYDFDGMETFTSGHMGITLSQFDDLPTGEEESPTQDAIQTDLRPPKEVMVDDVDPDLLLAPMPQLEPADLSSPAPIAGPLPVIPSPEAIEPSTDLEGRLSTTLKEPAPVLIFGERTLRQGDLQQYPFPVLFSACVGGSVSGQLVVRLEREDAPDLGQGLARRTVVFERGRPLRVTSALKHDRLVELLLRQGKLPQDLYEQCRDLVESTGRRPGAVLVQLGAIKTRELLPLVRWHYEELLFGCFAWRRGSFRLESRPKVLEKRIALERSGPELLLEGLRRRYGPEELEELLGGPEVRLRRRAERGLGLPSGALLDGEDRLLSLCDGLRSLKQVVVEGALDRQQSLAALYGLAQLGCIESESSRPELLPPDEQVDRKRLEHRIAQARESDYYSMLGLSPEASPYEIRRAYEGALQELTAERLAALGAQDLDEDLDEVRYILTEAFEVLSDDLLRAAYRQGRFD